MSIQPRLEARVSALERRQSNLEIRVEEMDQGTTTSIKQLSEDVTASFKNLANYQIESEKKNEERFSKIEERFNKIEATMATKEDLTAMATKEDLAAMETRILDAFKQLLTTINPQQN